MLGNILWLSGKLVHKGNHGLQGGDVPLGLQGVRQALQANEISRFVPKNRARNRTVIRMLASNYEVCKRNNLGNWTLYASDPFSL